MANDYYPDFYRRKRQRDRVFVVMRNVVLLVLVCALGAAFAYLMWRTLIAPRSNEPGATPQLADERQNMETQQKLQEARPNVNSGTVAEATAEEQRIDLQALPYAQSFPLVQVGIGEGNPTSADLQRPGSEPAAVPGGEETAGQAATTQPPLAGEAASPPAASGDGSTEQAAVKPADEDAAAAKAEAKKAEQKKADAKKAEQAKLDKKKADDAKKAEQAKKEEQEKPAPPAQSGGFTYRVYAGSTQSREAAEKLKSEVAATGVSAAIIQNGADYLLLVATLDDYDGAIALRDKLKGSGFSGAFTSRKSK